MTKKTRSSLSTRGFTLLEVLIAVLIVGIIATAAIPMLGSYTEKAREAREEANFQIKKQAADRYLMEHEAPLGMVYDPPTDSFLEYGIATLQGPSVQMLFPTDANGNVMGDVVGSNPGPFQYGPYLAELPPEPASLLLAATTRIVHYTMPEFARRHITLFVSFTGNDDNLNAQVTALPGKRLSGSNSFEGTAHATGFPHMSDIMGLRQTVNVAVDSHDLADALQNRLFISPLIMAQFGSCPRSTNVLASFCR